MSDELKKELEKQLWNIANELRGNIDPNEFKSYILGFIFLKYLSIKMENYANKLLRDGEETIEYIDIEYFLPDKKEKYLKAIKDKSLSALGYFLKPTELFSFIQKRGNESDSNLILSDLKSIFKTIEDTAKSSDAEDDFIGLFDDVDLDSKHLGREVSERNRLISRIMSHLDKLNFDINNNSDLLGDAYEYLIGQFASTAGKKGGEFFTPSEVSKLLSKIVTYKKKNITSVYDPTCGSGSLLLKVSKELQNGKDIQYFGQESNRTTYNLARMNMIMHGIHYDKFDIRQGDTLENPQHIDEKFEVIVANPPFSANWSASIILSDDDRFSQYGKLAPKSKADFAFIQHMIHQLDEKGTMAVIVPHGVLFRGSGEAIIRQYLIEKRNYLDAVIGLPANIFYGTSIPTAILVFKKCRENNKNVFFIDASKDFGKKTNQNHLRDEDIKKIMDTLVMRKTIDKYSYVASLKNLKENDYNLNIPRYVDTFEEEELIDLEDISAQLQQLDKDTIENDKVIAVFCDELGIKKPF